jgi:hypothetical protein
MLGENKSGVPPTGFIRTLPYGPNHDEQGLRLAYERMRRSLARLNSADTTAHVLIGLSTQPLKDVLHVYLIVEGRVVGRARLAGYVAERGPVQCFDGTTRTYPVWAELVGPYEPAPAEIKRRGFQGFRYTTDLW